MNRLFENGHSSWIYYVPLYAQCCTASSTSPTPSFTQLSSTLQTSLTNYTFGKSILLVLPQQPTVNSSALFYISLLFYLHFHKTICILRL